MPKRQNFYCAGKSATIHKCSLCEEYSTYSITGLRLHEKKKHPEAVVFEDDRVIPYCVKCNLKFENQAQYFTHMRKNKCFKK